MSGELILGGARSGKSGYALQQAQAQTAPVCWIATAEAGDAEMTERIQRHRAERPAHWTTLEAPLQLAAALQACRGRPTVVDCLTLWLANWLCRNDQGGWPAERQALLAAIATHDAPLYLVSNEVGFGIVPDNALARRFRDEAGRLHQDIARQIEQVTLVVAGIPLQVKGR